LENELKKNSLKISGNYSDDIAAEVKKDKPLSQKRRKRRNSA